MKIYPKIFNTDCPICLEKNNYKVKTAKNGKQGLEIVKNSKPGLILLDLMLPDMSGLEICRELRSSKKTKKLPKNKIISLNIFLKVI